MLDSVKIARRQSEIRQQLSAIVGKADPTEDETRSMERMDAEYRQNETRYRAALVAEDGERREAGAELESRSGKEMADLMAGFEVRQVALHLDEGRALDGKTAEVVQELRSRGGYRGIPVPYAALEQRAEVITMPTRINSTFIDRLFPGSVAARMGVQAINIGVGATAYPVSTSDVTAGWATTAGGDVPGPLGYSAVAKELYPFQHLGVGVKISRNALKSEGEALEQAVRRDLLSAIEAKLDQAIFLGTGIDGQPKGLITCAVDHEIDVVAVNAAASWSVFRNAVVRFMTRNAANSPGAVNVLIRPEVWSKLDDTLISGTAVSQWDRMTGNIPASNIVLTSNGLAAPAGSPLASTALLTTSAGGVAPAFLGLWGAVDLIRDPYTEALSGALRLTGLTTADIVTARPAQLEVLTGIQ